jgi:hypothetical protein
VCCVMLWLHGCSTARERGGAWRALVGPEFMSQVLTQVCMLSADVYHLCPAWSTSTNSSTVLVRMHRWHTAMPAATFTRPSLALYFLQDV